MRTAVLAIATAVTACAALAHEGVKNPAVMARMDGMKEIQKHLTTLGKMAKGESVFDAKTARASFAATAGESSRVVSLFQLPETDPKSEASQDIWENWAEFNALAGDMERVATDLAGQVATIEDLRPALAALGETCKACHAKYREER